jgi:DNA-binding MarR family transcriptional regulator
MEIYKPYKLKGSMVSILFIIGKVNGINQKDIANALILDQSTMSRDIKKLVSRDLVIINKGEDPRKSQLSLTKNGCIMVEEISPLWHNLHTKVESILGSYNIQNIDNITAALSNNINDLK